MLHMLTAALLSVVHMHRSFSSQLTVACIRSFRITSNYLLLGILTVTFSAAEACQTGASHVVNISPRPLAALADIYHVYPAFSLKVMYLSVEEAHFQSFCQLLNAPREVHPG